VHSSPALGSDARPDIAPGQEDKPATSREIADRFSDQVAHIVEGVTKLDKIHYANREDWQAENVRKMQLAMVSGVLVELIKLAVRPQKRRTVLFHLQRLEVPIQVDNPERFSALSGIASIDLGKDRAPYRHLRGSAWRVRRAELKRRHHAFCRESASVALA
jgi:(p)ppGpp synthase/HD superfamily hydrolase